MMRLLSLMLWMVSAGWADADDAVRVGIFGEVHSVTPLVVAGQKIILPEGLPVLSPLGQTAIARGDVLAVVAQVAEGMLVAVRVLEIFPVVGPVSARAGESAVIMGSSIHVPPGAGITHDKWVAVSGLWNGDTVITTNWRTADRDGFAQLAGVMDETGQRIGGSILSGIQSPVEGSGAGLWLFSGLPAADGLEVRLMSKGVFGVPVDLALWQGYASLPVVSQTYMIHGTDITGTARDAQMPQAGTLVTRCVHKGRVVVRAPDGLEGAFLALGCSRHTPAE